MRYYTVYLNRDDTIVASGTSRECATIMNKSINGFHSMVSKTKKGKQKKYYVVVDDCDDAELIDDPHLEANY